MGFNVKSDLSGQLVARSLLEAEEGVPVFFPPRSLGLKPAVPLAGHRDD